jgi:hypothetical protein
MERDESRGWISWQGKHRFLYPASEWDRRERGWFPRFDSDTPKMDGAIEMALNDGFEEVSRSHGGTTCGQKNIGGFEATLDGGNVGFNAVEELRGGM